MNPTNPEIAANVNTTDAQAKLNVNEAAKTRHDDTPAPVDQPDELERLTASKEWRLNCTGYDEGQMCCVEAGHPNRARLDAYIARRVLEELEGIETAAAPPLGLSRRKYILERIAVIKKEGSK
jgi:hypothetical protein